MNDIMWTVRYAWFGTILLIFVILFIECRRWLRERSKNKISSLRDRARFAIVLMLMAASIPAMAEGMSGWLHPEIIDRMERFIMTVGFSVFTALWFMFRAETRLDKNNELQVEQIRLLKKLLGEN